MHQVRRLDPQIGDGPPCAGAERRGRGPLEHLLPRYAQLARHPSWPAGSPDDGQPLRRSVVGEPPILGDQRHSVLLGCRVDDAIGRVAAEPLERTRLHSDRRTDIEAPDRTGEQILDPSVLGPVERDPTQPDQGRDLPQGDRADPDLVDTLDRRRCTARRRRWVSDGPRRDGAPGRFTRKRCPAWGTGRPAGRVTANIADPGDISTTICAVGHSAESSPTAGHQRLRQGRSKMTAIVSRT